MTWPEVNAALQHLAEERVGTHLRAARQQEDASIDRSRDALRREQQRHLR